ncbi:alanine racemase [Campylobacter canadensis]|uniref:alanine racemase n=1 Tax=Campylobacter canadensis TaxID=449520 RepID=UPI001553EA9D|nr:alanine racemase [Campylobacter canadensis]MBZ7994037.1 alanine racemase [Campylobacter canadensis]MBZ7995960.1 alanine racemase [Campylobacter canadensis]MBZ7999368.1 alanine racemase [Campylobacter canadensis]MBZ8001165.1 alanine racemase [Campylobacter canadensis]MBZ8003694.1 alanine racemase [Campylobacter canadensis]
MAYITINKENYFYNLNECLKHINNNIDNFVLILKDNAYGHGLLQISNLALEFGINFIALKNQNEAEEVKNKFKNILLLSQLAQDYESNENYILGINSLDYFNYTKKNDKIMLKLNTGMNRNGLQINELKQAIKIIKEQKLRFLGAYTHFSSPNNIDKQKKLYKEYCTYLQDNYDEKLFFHSSNSSAVFLNKNDDLAARCGLAQFGFCDVEANLKPVMSLYAQKLSSRTIQKDEIIGYDERFKATKSMLVSTYDLGYADGLIYKENIKIKNNIKILGKISMDSFVCESNQNELCIFDNAYEFAKEFNTTVYEIFVRLNQNIKKIII